MTASTAIRAAIGGALALAVVAGILFAHTPARDREPALRVVAEARERMGALSKLAARAQARAHAPLVKMTGNACSDCGCRGTNLKNVPEEHECARAWRHVLSSLEAAAGEPGAAAPFARDPWGSPYALDENQGEAGVSSCGTRDKLRSVGEDGTWGTEDDVELELPLAGTCP